MGSPPLAKVEQAIVGILDNWPEEEIAERALRSLLRNAGFRRSAPALYFTMMALADKACREDVRVVDGVEIRDRHYRRT